MKTVFDATVSKRPQNIPENNDVEILIQNRTKVDLEITFLEDQIEKLKDADPKGFLMDQLFERQNKIAHDAMCLDPGDQKKIATAMGQYYEVGRLIDLVKNFEEKLDTQKKLSERIGVIVKKLTERIMQRR